MQVARFLAVTYISYFILNETMKLPKLLKASVPKCQRIQDNTGIKWYFLYFKK